MSRANIDLLMSAAHSPLHNYVVPGLSSYLVGPAPHSPDQGATRLFVNSRTQHEHVTPHSHRFDFQCQVLRGEVINIIFTDVGDGKGDRYLASCITYAGKPGAYAHSRDSIQNWAVSRHHYRAGDWYSMLHDEVHSIIFSPDAVVLFIEGPQVSDSSLILEPWVDGEVVPTFRTEPWMFRKEPQS